MARIVEVSCTEYPPAASLIVQVPALIVSLLTPSGLAPTFALDRNCSRHITRPQVGGEKKIAIYTLRRVEAGEELAYDYKVRRGLA